MKSELLLLLLLCSSLAQIVQQNVPSSLSREQEKISLPYKTENTPNQDYNSPYSGSSPKPASISSLFSRLPSSTELNEIILSADSVAILRTVQTVASDDSLPCSFQVSYLSQLFGRIKSAIQQKYFSFEQLTVIIGLAEAQIERLSDEVGRLENKKKNSGLDQIRSQLDPILEQLVRCYEKMNQIDVQVQENDVRVLGFQKQLEIISQNSQKQRMMIINDKLNMVEVEAQIKRLEEQIQYARRRRLYLEEGVEKREKNLNKNEEKRENILANIRNLENHIVDLKNMYDGIKSQCTSLEIKAERLRTNMGIAQSQVQQINNQLRQLRTKINTQKEKLAYDDLSDLQHMVEALKSLVGGVEREIDRQYYYCYGEGAVQIVATGLVTVYVVRGQTFGSYVEHIYGKTIQNSFVFSDYSLYKINIFSDAWVGEFGYPFPIEAFVSHDLSFKHDFHCLNPEKAVSGSGKILKITSNTIEVRENRENIRLVLGACSRIESTKRLPEIGQNIVFNGVLSSIKIYNLYSATCW